MFQREKKITISSSMDENPTKKKKSKQKPQPIKAGEIC